MSLAHHTFESMGTSVHLTLDSQEGPVAEDNAAVERVFESWDQEFSRFRGDSDLMRLNLAKEEWTSVSQRMCRVLQACRDLAQETTGAFDPSVGELLAASGYGLPNTPQEGSSSKNGATPRGVLTHSYTTIEIDEARSRVRLAPRQVLEPAAFVKGAAIDDAASQLAHRKNFLINAGGDVLARGQRSVGADSALGQGNSQPWTIAIQHPRVGAAIVSALAATDTCVATSGSYLTKWSQEDRSMHHLIDMQAGVPRSDMLSVTVVTPRAADADSWSTAAFCLGLERGVHFLEEHAVPYLIIDTYNQVHKNELFCRLEINPSEVLR